MICFVSGPVSESVPTPDTEKRVDSENVHSPYLVEAALATRRLFGSPAMPSMVMFFSPYPNVDSPTESQ